MCGIILVRSGGVNMVYKKQCVFDNQLFSVDNFDDNSQEYQPNQDKIDALNEYKAMKKNKQDYKRYSSFKEILLAACLCN